ncbi:MAG: ABC transporter permease [Planctomycetota bacterium]|jgi:peptide/nickel transport system permease protein
MSAAEDPQAALETAPEASVEYASQWKLIRRRFARHRLAVAAMYVLLVLYLIAAFAETFAPYTKSWYDLEHAYCPPQLPRLSLRRGLYVCAVRRHRDEITKRVTYVEDRQEIIPLGFFVKGEPYKLWGLIPWDRHFIGVDRGRYRSSAEYRNSQPTFCLLGADRYGQDLLSRIIYGARISLSVGVLGILLTFVLGLVIGGISGYVGGAVDTVIQRGIEIINAFPKLPLWLALGALMPPEWSPVVVYFGITIVLSLLGWTRLARVVRGKILSLREEDYAVAAKLLGAGHGRIIFRHLLPGFASHIIVALTLSVPGMILGETSLSFLGLGLRPPVVSWGVMLQDCMNIQAIAHYPWMLLPVIFIVVTVLCFNFLGDGLRDAADPYASA